MKYLVWSNITLFTLFIFFHLKDFKNCLVVIIKERQLKSLGMILFFLLSALIFLDNLIIQLRSIPLLSYVLNEQVFVLTSGITYIYLLWWIKNNLGKKHRSPFSNALITPRNKLLDEGLLILFLLVLAFPFLLKDEKLDCGLVIYSNNWKSITEGQDFAVRASYDLEVYNKSNDPLDVYTFTVYSLVDYRLFTDKIAANDDFFIGKRLVTPCSKTFPNRDYVPGNSSRSINILNAPVAFYGLFDFPVRLRDSNLMISPNIYSACGISYSDRVNSPVMISRVGTQLLGDGTQLSDLKDETGRLIEFPIYWRTSVILKSASSEKRFIIYGILSHNPGLITNTIDEFIIPGTFVDMVGISPTCLMNSKISDINEPIFRAVFQKNIPPERFSTMDQTVYSKVGVENLFGFGKQIQLLVLDYSILFPYSSSSQSEFIEKYINLAKQGKSIEIDLFVNNRSGPCTNFNVAVEKNRGQDVLNK